MSAPLNSNNPFVPPIEDAKQGIQNFALYHYQSLLDAGFDVPSAKSQVAALLEQQYTRFCEQGQIPAKNIGTIEKKLEKSLAILAVEAKNNPSLRAVYEDLLGIQTQLKR